jgi:hypothetical protein
MTIMTLMTMNYRGSLKAVQPSMAERRGVRVVNLCSYTSRFEEIYLTIYRRYYINSTFLFRALEDSPYRVSQFPY